MAATVAMRRTLPLRAGKPSTVTVTPGGDDAIEQRRDLRAETAQGHTRVEALADISRRVRTDDDYVALLGVFGRLHGGLEAQLSAASWQRAWVGVGVDITAHCRAGLLVDDLAGLGMTATAFPVLPPFPCFGQAMGCLYVLEGSALGGPVVARMVQAAIGTVPTAFLTGRGRAHQWPAVRNAELAVHSTHGRNLPHRVFVRSAHTPIIGSKNASAIRVTSIIVPATVPQESM